LNFAAGQTTSNLVLAQPGANSQTCIYSSVSTHLIVDINGTHAGAYAPVSPSRVLDSRSGVGGLSGKLGAGSVTQLVLPAGSASALNVAVTEPTAAGWITVWPCGQTRPVAANLNFAAGQTTSNLVLAQPGANSQTCIYSSVSTHLIVDMNGTHE
jgi:hypothetical protein